MGDKLEIARQDISKLKRLTNEGAEDSTAATLGTQIGDFKPAPLQPPRPPADQQLRNGDFSHSTNTWWEAVAAPGTDKVKECALWFTHDAPVAGQVLDLATDARTNPVNKTLKTTAHSTYNPAYCDWDSANGVARLTGNKSLDALLAGSPVFPGRIEYFGARIAKRNSTIVIQEDNYLSAMLYNATPASENFMKAGVVFHLSGVVRDGVPPTTTERRYKVLAKTDRGYEFLSDELTLAGAPSDASFAAGFDVFLSWPMIDGVLSYEVYRHDITAAKYRLLYTVSSGANTYGDNNRQDNPDVGAYPAASNDRVMCYVATRASALLNIAIDGVSSNWDDLFLNIPVPSPLLSAASGFQVFRLAMSKAMDRQMVDVVSTAASKRVSSATGAFSALDTGRTATLYAADGVTVLHGPEAITFVDATHVDFATNVASNAAGAVLYIVGGGDHGLLVDMAHLSYVERAKYSSWPEDRTRTLTPTAAPNTSNQGGIGTGGDSGDPGDGGIGGCITMDCPTWIYEGDRERAIPFQSLRRGVAMLSGNLVPNYTSDLLPSDTNNLHIVRFENGIEVPCSPGQPFFTSFMDQRGISARRLRRGDRVITVKDGRVGLSRIREVHATGKPAKVGTPVLSPGHGYFAGYLRLPWHARIWRWLWPKDRGASGALLHNRKNNEDQFV